MYVSVLQLTVLWMDLIPYRLLDAEPQHFKDVISPPLCLLPVLLDQSCCVPDLFTAGLPDPVPPDSCLYKILMPAPFRPLFTNYKFLIFILKFQMFFSR